MWLNCEINKKKSVVYKPNLALQHDLILLNAFKSEYKKDENILVTLWQQECHVSFEWPLRFRTCLTS